MAKTTGRKPQAETAEGLGKFMVVGLVLVSALIAASCAGLSLYVGNGWLRTIAIYFSTGVVSSVLLLLYVIFNEMRKQDSEAQPEPSPHALAQTQERLGKAA
ncbi:hypothetical protein [Aliiruegeria sabulilitoris]|uniref:hypothetical protein n=1 Tax=Aliiruegeria sabulilitoris TaxID=1510458 RepID=UPI0012E3345C|nr:hypothetical protein [Aliiruegeria sabulilitoris]NDR56986.1 hypothetical protein [Pseudoruegeria sp. M32A2M]